jgi:hydrogenase maturation protein HypF
MDARRIRVSGTVQGVGFRPFVYALARKLGVRGWVRNTSSAVEIHAEGDPESLDEFTARLRSDAPPLARIQSLDSEPASPNGHAAFEILESTVQEADFQAVPPDIALCDDCARELFDPRDRRYLYPFINCTNCGPRLTIIRDVPYDRPRTSMASFGMCPRCRAEYENPADRRFDAQPVACPACGPSIWLWEPDRNASMDAPPPDSDHRTAILRARRLLREGRILAIRGLGGFHLACDAANAGAIRELRRRKRRSAKPFAVMTRDPDVAEACCEIGDLERGLLTGPEKPIVILRRQPDCPVVEEAAPGNGTLGVMLPYTPLHQMLLHRGDPILDSEPAPEAIVLTSGNLSEEPIAIGNGEALRRLGPLADAFLLHNREIIQRCDDSVARVFDLSVQPLRRSRGYAPAPILLERELPPVLAVGAELKNVFCLARGRSAFLSPHIGDMENAETLAAFEEAVERYQRLFHTQPEILAHDMHPGYLATRWACEHAGGRKQVAVQHHHAHAAACMADNSLPAKSRVIALAFDGTGYGTDGAIWGGEILTADYASFRREMHLEYLPLPGGDAAIRKPWRIAVGYAHALGIPLDGLPLTDRIDPREAEVVRRQAAQRINTVPTSSLGRLFDAAAALAGLRLEIDYEAQGAIELEESARGFPREEGEYPFQIDGEDIRIGGILEGIVRDIRSGIEPGRIGVRFHRTVRTLAVEACRRLRDSGAPAAVALSGCCSG